ncbi:hypothetical protein D9M68_766950 [compost metagenome]
MVAGQENVVGLVVQRHFVPRMPRCAHQLHPVAAQIDFLTGFDQPGHLEGRQGEVVDIAEMNRLRHVVQPVFLLEVANEGQVRQVDTVEVVQAA